MSAVAAKPPIETGLEKLELVTPSERQRKAQRSRNVAIGVALALFVVFVYVISIVKLGSSIVERQF